MDKLTKALATGKDQFTNDDYERVVKERDDLSTKYFEMEGEHKKL